MVLNMNQFRRELGINMNEEFIKKMIQAKRLEKEALKSILPESMISHCGVIEGELKSMIKEFAKDTAQKAVVDYTKVTQIIKEVREEQTTDKGQYADDKKQEGTYKSKVSTITIE